MQKIIYELQNNQYASVAQFIPYPKSKMHLLYMSFWEKYDWIMIDYQEQEVVIWDSFDEKHEPFEKISKLYLSKKNYAEIIQEWNKNIQNHFKYLTITQNDDGLINLEFQNTLSKNDLDIIEQDKREKLKYEKSSFA